ncbi:MAG: glutamate-cysteine ligase family protein [Rubrobacteraceae bacterium]
MGDALEDITRRFAAGFPPTAPSLRTVGREAEFPLVRPDGRAADVSRLWPLLLEEGGCSPVYDQGIDGSEFLIGVEGDAWSCVVEVGGSTVELSVGPRPTLHDLARDMEEALQWLKKAVREAGYHLLGFGIQPRTPASPKLLTPKRRYAALLEAIGPQWLKFCVTAGDQLQVDMGQGDLVRHMNLINAVSGIIVAFTANSSVYGGRPGRFASGREGLTDNMVGEPHRHGSSPRPYGNLEEYVRFLAGLRCLCLPDGRGGYRVVGTSFADHLRQEPSMREPEAAHEAFLFHEHYIWPSARPRARIGTLEVRPACQQPPGSTWVPSALGLGLIEAAEEVETFLETTLGTSYWADLLNYRRRAVRDGLASPEPVPHFLETLLDLAGNGLRRRGKGEEAFLEPARDLLERHSEPAARARSVFRQGGSAAVVREFSLS